MTMHDPPRLLAPGSAIDPGLRTLLEAGRDELPSAAQLDSMALRLGPGFVTPGLEPPIHSVTRWSSTVITLVATAVGVVVIAWWAPSRWPARPAKSPAHLQLEQATPPEVHSAPLPADAAPAAQREDAGSDGAVPEAARTSADSKSTPPKRALDHAAGRRSASAQRSNPADELLILDEAQHALQSDPERALAHAQRHRRLFPDGQYAQEREVIAIDALLDLQRFAPAHRRARAFLQRFPTSSYRPRVSAQLQRARRGDAI
jgi:hypothetical protein